MHTEKFASRDDCLHADWTDPFRHFRDAFCLPEEVIYLDGNSLGPLPKAVAAHVDKTMNIEWGQSLIKSWNEYGWFDLPRKLGDSIAKLIDAPPGSVIVADTISANLYKVLAQALTLRPNRKIVLSDSGNFPSDLYVAQGLLNTLGKGYELKIVAPEDLISSITEDTAVVLATEVDYRTSRLHNMREVTSQAHRLGALAIWDLAHSAGAIPVDLETANADFAVGCTYKYLNGGPGSPAFLYVRPDLQEQVVSPLWGWWSHAEPFAFGLNYRPASGIVRQSSGTQPILSLRALEAALSIWEDVDLTLLRTKSMSLSEIFIDRIERNCSTHGLQLAGPRSMRDRGSHVSFHCPHGFEVMQAMIAQGVIGDFRAPDLIRFGLTPLYTRYVDVWDAAGVLAQVLDNGLWKNPKFSERRSVT